MATKKIIKRVSGKRVPALVTGKKKKKISSAKAASLQKQIRLLDDQFVKLVETDAVTQNTIAKGKETIRNKLNIIILMVELGELENLQHIVQMVSQTMTTMSNALKQVNETASKIIKNLGL